MGSTGESADQDMLAPDLLPHSPQISWANLETLLWAWLLTVAVVKLHDGDLHAAGWGEGPSA